METGNKEAFVALLYSAYHLIQYDVVLELSWLNSLDDYIKPYEISIKKEQQTNIQKLSEQLAEKSGEAGANASGQPLMLMNSANTNGFNGGF